MKTTVIIQARMGSSRLPGKVLLKILDKTILEYIIERLKASHRVKQIVIATTNKSDDNPIVNLAQRLPVEIFRGSENDVLDRYYQAAKFFQADPVVRITADCPLIDPELVDQVIKEYFLSGKDYCANILERTFPDGQDVEVLSFEALKRAWQEAKLPSDREHVTTFIRKSKDVFGLTNVRSPENLSDKRWTLDRPEDFEFIKSIIVSLSPSNPDFRMNDVLDFLRLHPALENLNKHIIPGEGYTDSLKRDRMFFKENAKDLD